MKKQFIYSLLMLLFSINVFSQSSGKLITEDESTRIKLAVHLITYDTIGNFENAVGEAYYTLVVSSFKENLSIPQFSALSITANDKAKTDKVIKQLNQLKQNPPSWDDLLAKETQYRIWLDKVTHRQPRYK